MKASKTQALAFFAQHDMDPLSVFHSLTKGVRVFAAADGETIKISKQAADGLLRLFAELAVGGLCEHSQTNNNKGP